MISADNTPLTVGDLVNLVESLRVHLENPPAGSLAMPHEVVALHSDNLAECDGKRIRLYDLVGGRTGCQIDDGPIRYCD
jgi:hypothetical protein